MIKSSLAVAGFVLSLSFAVTAHAKLYKWVDDKGVTHYGEVIPAEYANKDRDTLNKSGMVEKRAEKSDPATLRAKQEAEKQRKIDQQAEVEQKRRDSALLNTYSNEAEIDQARDRSLVLISARIESNRMLLKSSQDTLADLKEEVATRTKEGKSIPASLTKDITQTEQRVGRYADELKKSEDELAVVKTRFEKDKELYRKLKTSSPSR